MTYPYNLATTYDSSVYDWGNPRGNQGHLDMIFKSIQWTYNCIDIIHR